MEFTIAKKEQGYEVLEEGRVIFTCDYEYEERLLSVHLRNIYGDEAISIYQIKKWYSPLKPKLAVDFTIYEGEVKMGELHKTKGFFTFDFQGVSYSFFGGVHASKHKIICFDRDHMCAQMELGKPSTLRFENSTLGAMMSILCVLLEEFQLLEHFSQDLFLQRYEQAFAKTLVEA